MQRFPRRAACRASRPTQKSRCRLQGRCRFQKRYLQGQAHDHAISSRSLQSFFAMCGFCNWVLKQYMTAQVATRLHSVWYCIMLYEKCFRIFTLKSYADTVLVVVFGGGRYLCNACVVDAGRLIVLTQDLGVPAALWTCFLPLRDG